MAATRRSARVTLAPVNVVVGDEELLVDRAVRALINVAGETNPGAADPAIEGAEVHDLAAGRLTPGDLIELTSPSLFSVRRVVVIRSAQDLGKDLAAEITAYAANPAEDVSLVVVHAGGAKGKALLDGLVKTKANRIDCPKPTRPGERIDFIRGEIRTAGRTITESAARGLLDAVGNDLRELASACGQLAADTTGTIDDEIVARYHRGRAEVSGFNVADRAIEGNSGDALEQLRWALAVGTSPVLITSALAQGLRALAKVGGAPRGLRGPALAKELGMPPWKVDRVRQQLRGWNAEGVAQATQVVAETDAQVKGGGADPAYALERAIHAIIAARAPRR
ncbi:MAG: DNA polymerase III subunit delta [Streptosporangiales bacterium]|nr:DNA polymerase III subunit delta [Streptosporangiales bacterium]